MTFSLKEVLPSSEWEHDSKISVYDALCLAAEGMTSVAKAIAAVFPIRTADRAEGLRKLTIFDIKRERLRKAMDDQFSRPVDPSVMGKPCRGFRPSEPVVTIQDAMAEKLIPETFLPPSGPSESCSEKVLRLLYDVDSDGNIRKKDGDLFTEP